MSCTAVGVRLNVNNGIVTILPPPGFTLVAPFVLPTSINCMLNATFTIGEFTIDNITDKAYFWFAENAFTVQNSSGNFFYIGVGNATAASPLQVPLACNFCVPPMTGETYMRLTRGRATATGPGSDVRIVARRTWGDDFAGCNTCNRTTSAAISGVSTGIISGAVASG